MSARRIGGQRGAQAAEGCWLADLQGIAERCREHGDGLSAFLVDERIRSLGWPHDVTEQFLYDHTDYFIYDYGHVDLRLIEWTEESIALQELLDMPTGASDEEDGLLEYNAANHKHLVDIRNAGMHVGVRESWENLGTWKRSPLLIERRLVDPTANGLQVLEGRTRVGVLRGRAAAGCPVSEEHLAWVGRRRLPPA